MRGCNPPPRPVPTAMLPRATLSAPAMVAPLPASNNMVGDNLGTTATTVTTDNGEVIMMINPSAIQQPRRQSFRAPITPVIDMKTPSSPLNTGGVTFTSRKIKDTVGLQWEPFNATISANGVRYLNVGQAFGNLPPHAMQIPYSFRLNGVGKTGFVLIDPFDSSANIKFSLDQDDRNMANIGDTFETSGGMVSWICSY